MEGNLYIIRVYFQLRYQGLFTIKTLNWVISIFYFFSVLKKMGRANALTNLFLSLTYIYM